MRKVCLCGMRKAASSVGSSRKRMSMRASATRRRSRVAFEELAKSEAELRTIVDATPQLIVTLRADGTFLSANQAVLDYTGLTKKEVRMESFRDVFQPEDSERLREQRDLAISRGVPFEYERRVRRRDGQYRWLLVQYNPLRDQRREVTRAPVPATYTPPCQSPYRRLSDAGLRSSLPPIPKRPRWLARLRSGRSQSRGFSPGLMD
jgi:PAS domain S-box-containing protein